MNRWAIWAMVLGPLLVIGVATYLIVRPAPEPVVAVTETVEKRPIPLPTTKPVNTEVDRLKNENNLLTKRLIEQDQHITALATRISEFQQKITELESEKKALATEIEVHTKAQELINAVANDATAHPQVENVPAPQSLLPELRAYADRVRRLLEQKSIRLWHNEEYSVDIKVNNVDIKKSDSLVNPWVGVIVLTECTTFEAKSDIIFVRTTIDEVTATVARQNDKWVLVSIESKRTFYSAVPDDPQGARDIGKVSRLSTEVFSPEFEAANSKNPIIPRRNDYKITISPSK